MGQIGGAVGSVVGPYVGGRVTGRVMLSGDAVGTALGGTDGVPVVGATVRLEDGVFVGLDAFKSDAFRRSGQSGRSLTVPLVLLMGHFPWAVQQQVTMGALLVLG